MAYHFHMLHSPIGHVRRGLIDSEALIYTKVPVVFLEICYHDGENGKGCMGSLANLPYNPELVLTRLEVHPTVTSIMMFQREVTIHEFAYHFPSLRIVGYVFLISAYQRNSCFCSYPAR